MPKLTYKCGCDVSFEIKDDPASDGTDKFAWNVSFTTREEFIGNYKRNFIDKLRELIAELEHLSKKG